MIRITLLAVAVVSLLSSTVRSQETIRVVADEWPPFSGEALPGKGISIDVITEVLTRAGYRVESEILPWARIMGEARSGNFDVIGSLFSDPEIAEFMTYGDPFYQTKVQFLRRSGTEHQITEFADLHKFSIAVGDGFLYSPEFDRAKDLNKVVVATALQGIQMVAFDRADLTLDSVEVLEHSIVQSKSDLAERVEFLPFVLTTHGVHMAIRNSHPDAAKVVADFNRVLAKMEGDGSLQRLLSKHR